MRPVLTLLLVVSLAAAFGCGNEPVPPPAEETDAGTTNPPPPPPPPLCDPACTATQRCDITGEEPLCVEICNAPDGCLPKFEECNTTTAQCEPLTCNGNKCERGQGCFDTTRSDFPSGGDSAVCSCTPAYRDGEVNYPDSCNVYGLVCDFNRGTRAPAKCTMPGEGQPCIPAIGCDATAGPLECRTVHSNFLCVRACTSSDDCSLATDYCATSGFCEPNLCARRSDGSLDRSKLFAACDAKGTGDGTCLPRVISGKDSGLCVQNGTAATGAECYPEATRAEADKLCGAGEVCEAIQPHATNGDRTQGICFKACNAATGQQASPRISCATGSRCRAIADGSNSTRLGACHAECDLVGGKSDCPDDALGNKVGCFQSSSRDAEKGYCLSVHPKAGETNGSPCAVTGTGDERRDCGSRKTCTGRSNPRCFDYCDVTMCPNANQSCSHCGEGTSRCTRIGNDNNAEIGVCQP